MDTVEITVTPQIVAGRYELIRELGAGGMGTVYLVRHVNTDERLAMKVLRKDVSDQLEAVERFKREMKASAILRSDNVTRITDADIATELGGAMYLVMELLDGADVQKLLNERQPLDKESVVFILGQASRALDKAHALGIIHRDKMPSNVPSRNTQ
ncbi:MAG: protein kinase [Myxococcales bacterium]|nr:protein kinase [Myxococcales bacterium]